MTDRGRYDSAMFWLALGTAASVIGLALMTIGVTRASSGTSLLDSPWFDVGLCLLAIGAVLLIWALALYLARRRGATQAIDGPRNAQEHEAQGKSDAMTEAVRGYYAERERLLKIWQQDRKRNSKSP